MADVFLTPGELAQRWRMSTHTLQNWRVQNFGPPFTKMGEGRSGKVLYRLDDIEAYEAKRRPRNAP